MIEDFLTQYPASTQEAYGRVLREFAGYTDNVEWATAKEIVNYQKSIAHQAPATVSRKLATLCSFYHYMQKRNHRLDDPTVAVRRPTVDPVRSIRWLTTDEIRRLLEAVNDDPRTLAMVWLGLHSLRVGEIVGLDVTDYSEGSVTVHGKGSKTRLIPLVSAAQVAVEKYIGKRKSGPLFMSRSRNRLSRRHIQYIISSLSGTVDKRLYPHALRHTFGTNAIRSGNSTLAVQKVMGHATPQTTEKYVHLDVSDNKVTVERTYGQIGTPLTLIVGGRKESKLV